MSKSEITKNERLNLNQLLQNSDAEDNTQYIRRVKHSEKIRDNIRIIDRLMEKEKELYKTNKQAFRERAQQEANFLFTNYTDIFNKVLAGELDFKIMTRLLMALKLIEDGKVDQHEGSVLVGKTLKELYVDSALKRSDNLDKQYEKEEKDEEPKKQAIEISWKDWKAKTNEKK